MDGAGRLPNAIRLNEFLNELGAGLIPKVTLERKCASSVYKLGYGSWRLVDIGMEDQYALSKVGQPKGEEEWNTSKYSGNIEVLSGRLTLSGIIVFLGEDIP